MPLAPATLKFAIKTVFDAQKTAATPEDAAEAIAEGIAQAVHAYITSATVVIPIGAVAVVGSASAQANPAPVIGSLA
jgi:hypothetical protein